MALEGKRSHFCLWLFNFANTSIEALHHLCWRRLDETGGEEVGSTTVPFLSDSGHRKLSARAPAEWGARANELKSAVDELAAFQASQLEPGDAPATMGSDSAIAVSIMSEFAMAAQAWQLQAQLRATVRASSHTK